MSFDGRDVLRDVEWRIAPGERTAVLGANGAGKSTLLGLIAGTLEPTAGRVRHGKTVRIAVLDQQFRELDAIADERVRDVLARARTSYEIDGRELTPAQLLERLGFAREHLSARVGELSGGQQRRFQLLLVLLSEPNVLLLDEPTNDVDTDMLAAMEDLLDSWPGTLIVVSHDRYLVERVTDQQYAIIDGRLRHLPGGVEEYLRLRAQRLSAADEPDTDPPVARAAGAEQRATRKELGATERKLTRLTEQIAALHVRMADHDHADFGELARMAEQLRTVEGEVAELEDRWLELSELT